MYISDYGYAMDQKYWHIRLGQKILEGENYSTYSECNWLNLKGITEWLLWRDSSNSYRRYTAGDIGTGNCSKAHNIRPVFYLVKNVQKTKGTGLITNPYRITM